MPSRIRYRDGEEVVIGAVSLDASRHANPVQMIAKDIRDALNPTKAPSKPKTWAEMTETERAEMRRLYEKK